MTRFDFARRNAYYGYLSTLSAIVLGFIVRTIFIAKLGSSYLGVDALMTNVLGVLSFLELGIGAAMSYSLYKPVADENTEKVRALLRFYRKVYRVIALTVTLIGLAILPFIPTLARGSEGLGDLRIYYALFLASNVISYFAVYKTSVANAEQRRYLGTNIHAVSTVVVQLSQAAMLLMGASYLAFLVVMLVGRVAEQLYLNYYLNRRYKEYLKAPEQPISSEELEPIKRNVKSLIWHKIGEVGVNQTDSIIIAAFLNVTLLGIVSNYNLVINSFTLVLTVTLTAALGSFGNAIATSEPADVYRNYKAYRLAAFWLYGVTTIGMYVLLTPFISLWIGSELTLSAGVLLLMIVNFYMAGQRLTMITVRSAAGIWTPDKYLPLAQTVINLVVSLALVHSIGLIGVYIGTLAQGIVATVVRPLIIYPRVFGADPKEYFIDGARYAFVLVVTAACPSVLIFYTSIHFSTWLEFAVAVIVLFAWINVVFFIFLGDRPETRQLRTRLRVFPPRSSTRT